MMIADLSDKKLSVTFYHPTPKSRKSKDPVRYTHCRLLLLDQPYMTPAGDTVYGPKSIALGAAGCSRSDNFCKAVGRDIALYRALKIAAKHRYITNADWKTIWKAYVNTCARPSEKEMALVREALRSRHNDY